MKFEKHGDKCVHLAAGAVEQPAERGRGHGGHEVDETHEEVGGLLLEAELGPEEALRQRHEREDGAVVGERGEAQQPEAGREVADVPQRDPRRRRRRHLRRGLGPREVRGAAGVEGGQQEAAEEGEEGEGGGCEERPAQGGGGVEAGGEAAVQPLHHQEVDGGAQPADAQLEAEHHVEVGVAEPGHGVGVHRHVQAHPAHPEHEPGQWEVSTGSRDQMPRSDWSAVTWRAS